MANGATDADRTMRQLLLIMLDEVPYRVWRRLIGNLEGWVAVGVERVWTMRAVMPSTPVSRYAYMHAGLSPQVSAA